MEAHRSGHHLAIPSFPLPALWSQQRAIPGVRSRSLSSRISSLESENAYVVSPCVLEGRTKMQSSCPLMRRTRKGVRHASRLNPAPNITTCTCRGVGVRIHPCMHRRTQCLIACPRTEGAPAIGQIDRASQILDAFDAYQAAMAGQDRIVRKAIGDSPYHSVVIQSLDRTGLLRKEIATRLEHMASANKLVRMLTYTLDVTPWVERHVRQMARDLDHTG